MSEGSRQELIRRAIDRWNAGEREIDPQVLHHDIVFHSQLTNATYHGHDGWRRWMAEIDDQFEDWHSFIDEFRDAGEDRLLALGTVHLRGRGSGVEFDQPMGWLLTFAGDQVIELRTIPDHAQALQAAGLSEQAMAEESHLEAERELTLLAYEAWNAKDFDAAIADVDPDIEWSFAGGAQFPGTDDTYRGHEGVRRFWREFIEPWESIRLEVTGTRESGDTLVVFVNFHGVGAGSGVKLTVPFVHLLKFRNRKVVQLRGYGDRGEALEAAGLSE